MSDADDGRKQILTALRGIAIILFSLHLSLFYVHEGETAAAVYRIGLGLGGVGLVVVLLSVRRP
ncbi:hypothetical protein ACFQMA_12945 [Halosimplex aquaticum]|uniref:PEP-CTERM protein-sorting domain-containing protein n=1 Tax=Halosimplex aquaticum TaxID=3026162 RepID=A0ABD5Y008_9EURY|nr:hypothetical protein [Halosimplex aquaticum]